MSADEELSGFPAAPDPAHSRKPDWIQLWEAIIRRAHGRCPSAGVIDYVSPPFPVAANEAGAQEGWHPFERPRQSESDVAWFWLEEARRETRQALVDGRLTVLYRQLDGVLNALPPTRWADKSSVADLRLCKPEWCEQGEGLLIDVAAFRAWMKDVQDAPQPQPLKRPLLRADREAEFAERVRQRHAAGQSFSIHDDREWGRERGVNREQIAEWRARHVDKKWEWSTPGKKKAC